MATVESGLNLAREVTKVGDDECNVIPTTYKSIETLTETILLQRTDC